MFVKVAFTFYYLLYLTNANNIQDNYIKTFTNILQNNSSSRVSEKCEEQLSLYINGLVNKETWALHMFDATSKLQSGIFVMNLIDLGNYDECLVIKANLSEEINGKYCMGRIKLPDDLLPSSENFLSDYKINNGSELLKQVRGGNFALDFALRWTACIPDGCSAKDIETKLSEFIDGITFNEEECQSKATEPELNNTGIATIVIFVIIFFLMLVSTIYDVIVHYRNRKITHELFIAFSVFSNGQKLLRTSNDSRQLLSIHGLKAISMMWVLICHGYMAAGVAPVSNLLYVVEWLRSHKSLFISGGTVAVDTFFVIGGLLAVYTSLGSAARGIKFNIPLYYIHRYLRLTPALGAAILVHLGLLLHLGSGPFFPSVTQSVLVKDCETNWWKALLYFQNYFNGKDVCVPQSWYLSVDMQLFIISPIFLIPLKKHPKVTLGAAFIAALASMAASFAVGWHYELKGDLGAVATDEDSLNLFVYYYYPTHTRMAPYLFGIILGYYVYQIKNGHKKINLNKITVFILWIISLTLLVVCVFGGHHVKDKTTYNRFEHSMYIAFIRPTWAIGICWVIFACTFGYGGPINWFLSWPAFQIVSKLSYCMYIVHYSMVFMRYSAYKVSFRFSDFDMMYNFWGDFWLATAISVLWTLMFESPMIIIERVIFGKSKKNDKQKPNAA